MVGAGPAGSTAARALAIAGARVTILEKSRFPRQKPCGGAISLRALSRFPYLAAALARISTHRVSRLFLEGPGGASATVDSLDPAVLMIRRVEFDELLMRLACEAGADLLEGVEITHASLEEHGVKLVDRRGRCYGASFVVAGDGVNSMVARRLGLNAGWPAAHLALDMMEETPSEELRAADPGAIWVSYCPEGSCGYAYVFPKRDHVNVGTGSLLSHFRERAAEKPYARQRQLVDGLASRGLLVGSSSR
ncbi:MAG: FAD-dependent monooxygenase, partial [Acidobacteria bacterium]|nr:FAD-dependent monooxygenase [Acidobacteriota bacterium]